MSNNSIKYLWERLRSEFYKWVRDLKIEDPINENSFRKILICLGFMTNQTHTKVIKGKEVVLEDALMKKIMHILRMPKVVAKGVYNEPSESLVTLNNVKAFLAAIAGVSVNENENIPLQNRFKIQGKLANLQNN